MSTSWYVRGVRPPDERWRQMKVVYDACVAAGVDIPDTVAAFFDGDRPDPDGVVIDIPQREWRDQWRCGIEVDVADLPADVKTIRFIIST